MGVGEAFNEVKYAYDNLVGGTRELELFINMILIVVLFIWVPCIVGLWGTYRRKPWFLMVPILDVFVLTGCKFTDLASVIHSFYPESLIETVLPLLIMWCLGFLWYSHYLELKKELKLRQTEKVPAC